MTSASAGVSVHGAGLDPERGGLLLAEYRHVEELLELLGVAALQGRGDLGAAWEPLAKELEGHLAIEESELLPRFQPCQPAIAGRLLAEHVAIRAVMREVAAGVERGMAPVEPVRRLAKLVSEHAEGERRDFYPWVERRLMTWVWGRVRRAISTTRAPAAPSGR